MNDSILTSVKKALGIPESYEQFDPDIIMHINTTLFVLNQLGVGPSEGFVISNKSATWTDFMGSTKALESVKSYVYLKTRMLFDPPTSSAAIESFDRLIAEMEWRIREQVEDSDSVASGDCDYDVYYGHP